MHFREISHALIRRENSLSPINRSAGDFLRICLLYLRTFSTSASTPPFTSWIFSTLTRAPALDCLDFLLPLLETQPDLHGRATGALLDTVSVGLLLSTPTWPIRFFWRLSTNFGAAALLSSIMVPRVPKSTKGGSFPVILSQSILMFGLWTMLDPIAIMVVDACLGRFQTSQSQPIADGYLLYAHFLLIENSGLVGIPITIFVYLGFYQLRLKFFHVSFSGDYSDFVDLLCLLLETAQQRSTFGHLS